MVRFLVIMKLDELLEKSGRQNINVQRYKGLGEMNADQLWETTMKPWKLEQFCKLSLEDAMAADEIFTTLMGDKVEPRREFIQTHAREITELDI